MELVPELRPSQQTTPERVASGYLLSRTTSSLSSSSDTSFVSKSYSNCSITCRSHSHTITYQRLPLEIKLLIFSFLDAASLGRSLRVCKEWQFICAQKDLWYGKRKSITSRKSIPFGDTYGEPQIYRIVMVGAGGTGKSAVAVRFLRERFVEKYDPTLEDVYTKQVMIDGQLCQLDIVDTAGHEEYAALRDQYIRTGAGFLIFYSLTSQVSFSAAIKLRNSILKAKEGMEEAPIILVGNKLDLDNERKVTREQGQAMANQWSKFTHNFFETSAKLDLNCSEIYFELVRQMDTLKDAKRRKAIKKRKKKCAIM